MPRPSSSSWTVPSLYLRTHLNSYTPSGFHSKMQQALQYMRSCQITVKILTGNSSSLLFKLPCQQTTFQGPDFKDAVLRAVTAVFGRHINHKGCFYHLTQASWRQIQQLGLVPLYKNDDDLRVFCGMMDGLAFLPVPDLTNGIHPLRTLCPDDPPEAAELLDYFDSTYTVVDLDSRIQHKIKLSVWS